MGPQRGIKSHKIRKLLIEDVLQSSQLSCLPRHHFHLLPSREPSLQLASTSCRILALQSYMSWKIESFHMELALIVDFLDFTSFFLYRNEGKSLILQKMISRCMLALYFGGTSWCFCSLFVLSSVTTSLLQSKASGCAFFAPSISCRVWYHSSWFPL